MTLAKFSDGLPAPFVYMLAEEIKKAFPSYPA
jgi:hypothetical protein